jgi:thiamine biosynthesis lipoprotein
MVQVSIAGTSEEQSNQAFALLQDRFQKMHRDWHAWEPSQLTAINAAFAQGKTIKAEPEMLELIRLSQQAEARTGGRFNPAIGQLIEIWGFHTSDFPVHGPVPTEEQLATLVAQHPSTSDIEITADGLYSRNPAVQLDFGGIAKGFAVDIAGAELRGLGVQNAIVNAGGDLRAFGTQGNRPWRVAIKNPLGGILGGLEIRGDESVFTSGNYERYLETANKQRFAHIIDPGTGRPAREVLSATVITTEGWLGDAAATAFVVAGLSEWAELAQSSGIKMLLLTDENGQIYATPEMLERVQLTGDREAKVLSDAK